MTSLLSAQRKPRFAGLFEADGAGFEPAIRFDPYAALAKRCLQPLGHPSPESNTHDCRASVGRQPSERPVVRRPPRV